MGIQITSIIDSEFLQTFNHTHVHRHIINMQFLPVLAVTLCCLFGVRADWDFDGDDLYKAWIMETFLGGQSINNNPKYCAAWSTTSTAERPCCQYGGRYGRMKAFKGQCLQQQCGYQGQMCGYYLGDGDLLGQNLGDCCWHLGLTCQVVETDMLGFPRKSMCLPPNNYNFNGSGKK